MSPLSKLCMYHYGRILQMLSKYYESFWQSVWFSKNIIQIQAVLRLHGPLTNKGIFQFSNNSFMAFCLHGYLSTVSKTAYPMRAIILKMTTILKEMRIAQLCSKSERTLVQKCFDCVQFFLTIFNIFYTC